MPLALQNSLKLPVDELELGMYVSQLDCDWTETPFLLQGLLIQSFDDIDILSEFCDHVWVDIEVNSREAYGQPTQINSNTRKIAIRKIASPKEIKAKRAIYSESRASTARIMEDIRLGGAIDTAQAKHTVSSCVDSIVKDPATMLLLSKLREKDNYTSEHSLNVCVLAIAFGRALAFNELELNQIGICGLLHDVGKMKIPSETLNKTGKLSDEEWLQIQKHPEYGRDLLMKADGIYPGAIDAAYSHHERIDGTGYPRAMKASGISQYAKIISIVDAYDAMTAQRCYSGAKTPTQALKILRDYSGTQFDGHLVESFMNMIGMYPPGSIVELRNGHVGIVVSRNLKYQHLPKILVVRDAERQPCNEQVHNLARIEQQKMDPGYLIKHDHVDGTFAVHLADFVDKGLSLAG